MFVFLKILLLEITLSKIFQENTKIKLLDSSVLDRCEFSLAYREKLFSKLFISSSQITEDVYLGTLYSLLLILENRNRNFLQKHFIHAKEVLLYKKTSIIYSFLFTN